MIVLKIAATSNARHTLDRNSKICLLILKPTATYCEQIFTYTRSTVRHIRLLCFTAASPTRLIHLIRSPALSTQSSVLLSPAYTHTQPLYSRSPTHNHRAIYSLFYFILLVVVPVFCLLTRSPCLPLFLSLSSSRVCSVRFKSLIQFDFLQIANTLRTIRMCKLSTAFAVIKLRVVGAKFAGERVCTVRVCTDKIIASLLCES